MDAHAVKCVLFDGELPHLLLVMVLEVQLDVSTRPALTHQLDLDDLHLSRLVLLQLLFLDVSQQALLVLLKRLIVFILNQPTHTRESISERLTLKFWTAALVLAGS